MKHIKISRYILGLYLIINAVPSLAGNSFEELLETAYKNNHRLQALEADAQSQELKASYQNFLPDPVLNYGFYAQEVETKTGPQTQRISLTQAIPLWKKRSDRKEVENLKFLSIESDIENTKYSIRRELISRYSELYFLTEKHSILKRNEFLAQQWYEVAEQRYKTSLLSNRQVIQARIQLINIAEKIEYNHSGILNVQSKIRDILDSKESITFGNLNPLTIKETPEYNQKQLNAHPAIKTLQFSKNSLTVQEALASKNGLPDIVIGFDYILTASSETYTGADNGKDPFIIKAGMNIPLWRKKYKRQKEEFHTKAKSISYKIMESQSVLEKDFSLSMNDYQYYQREFNRYSNEYLPELQKLLKTSEAEYYSGSMGMYELLDVQENLLTYEIRQKDAQRKLWMALANLEYINGHIYLVSTGENHENK